MPLLASVRFAGYALAIAGCLVLTGCLPLPSYSEISTPLRGVVLDSLTGKAIAQARIDVSRSGYHTQSITDLHGAYTVSPLLQWHYLVYIGDPGVYPSPFNFEEGDAPLVVSAWAPGYVPQCQLFSRRLIYVEPQGPKNGRPVNFKLEPVISPSPAPP